MREFAAALLDWYARARRDLPWRTALGERPDAYRVLVSEAMLQQTQVATVVPYFHRFMARFPSAAALAEAPEQDVLRLWQGLGYYARARNLQKAARAIVGEHGGHWPTTVDGLLALPGVGRYTAGAVASIAFGQPAPIVDGNVARVVCRLDQIESDPRATPTIALLWRRATELVESAPPGSAGDFNSALMELGATVCTPRNPRCLTCPVRAFCRAAAAGLQEHIPAPRKTRVTPVLERHTLCLRHPTRDAYAIEQRPTTGRWGGLWQFSTAPTRTDWPPHTDLRELGVVRHALTHRRYVFHAATATATDASTAGVWATPAEFDNYPMAKPQLTIARLLRAASPVW